MKFYKIAMSAILALALIACEEESSSKAGAKGGQNKPKSKEIVFNNDDQSKLNEFSYEAKSRIPAKLSMTYTIPSGIPAIRLASSVTYGMNCSSDYEYALLIEKLDSNNQIVSSEEFSLIKDYNLDAAFKYHVKLELDKIHPSCQLIYYGFGVTKLEQSSTDNPINWPVPEPQTKSVTSKTSQNQED